MKTILFSLHSSQRRYPSKMEIMSALRLCPTLLIDELTDPLSLPFSNLLVPYRSGSCCYVQLDNFGLDNILNVCNVYY